MAGSIVNYRKMERSDRKALERMISDTWRYERLCSNRMAKRMARTYLMGCLSDQTFTCVAEKDGEPVGVIMGKREEGFRTPLHNVLQSYASLIPVVASGEGRRIIRLFGGFDDLNEEMLAESGCRFGGELSFFAVRPDQCGTGIGKELFIRLIEYMRSQGISDFYIHTDTACNVGFYDHQGAEKICERVGSLKPYLDEEIRFFLYRYDLD